MGVFVGLKWLSLLSVMGSGLQGAHGRTITPRVGEACVEVAGGLLKRVSGLARKREERGRAVYFVAMHYSHH